MYSSQPGTYRELTFLASPPTIPYSLTLYALQNPNLVYPVNVTTYNANGMPIGLSGTLQSPVGRDIFDPNARTMYAEQWSFNYQRQSFL